MSQEWNWQIDELKRQQEANASRIESAIRDQTQATIRANERASEVGSSGSITDVIPKEVIWKWIKRISVALIILSVLVYGICFVIGIYYQIFG